MIIAEHKDGENVDVLLPKIISIARRSILHPKKSDDALFIVAGNTGTGKSRLTLHCVTLFTPNPNPAQISLNRESFADSVKRGLSLPKGERYVDYDESEVGKREGMTRWNRDMISLYFKIREEGFLHFWNHPSPNNIDLEFIRERVNGLFLCYDKSVARSRRYYFFTKERLLSFLERFKILSTRNLLKYASEYATYRGSFKDYEGPLLQAYKANKKEGMRQAIEDFAGQYGSGGTTYTASAAARKLHINVMTAKKLITELLDSGKLNREEVVSVSGYYRLTEEHLLMIGELQKKKTEDYRLRRGFNLL